MAGIFTQERSVIGPMQDMYGTFRGRFFNPRGNDPSYVEDWQISQRHYIQQTTSFRSGLPYDLNVTPGDLIRSNSGSILRPHDTGHEFASRKGKFRLSHPFWHIRGVNGASYRGPLCPPMKVQLVSNPIDNHNPHDYQDFPVDLQYGTRAIKQVSPTKMAANLTQLVAELRIQLPKKPFATISQTYRKRDLPSASADEYLNMVFGWQPTVSDFLKIAQACVNSHEILTNFYANAGQQVRRRYGFEPIIESKSWYDEPYYSGLAYYLDPNSPYAGNFYPPNKYENAQGWIYCTETKETNYWFSGAFQYAIPSGSSAADKIAEMAATAKKLLGIQGLTLDLAYQLIPFSWLLDYFASVGDIISNASMFSQDNLVMPYAYLMRRTVVKRVYGHSGVTFYSGPTGPITHSEVFTDKRRVRATPYGFGLSPDGFSPAQWAILAALGLTKSDRTLF